MKLIVIELAVIGGLMGDCMPFGYDGATYYVEIVSKLSYPISAVVESQERHKKDLGIILPNEMVECVTSLRASASKNANKGIRRISIYTEDGTLWILLKGSNVNKYLVYRKESTVDDIQKGRESWCKFRLEVTEELMGIGLKKDINFEEIEDPQFEVEDEQFEEITE